MNMTRARAVFVVVLVFISTGCTVDLDVILFNTTGEPIQVLVGERLVNVPPLGSMSFKASALYAGHVSVRHGDREYRYLLQPSTTVPTAYYRSSGWAADIWVQLDSDFQIHLIPTSVSQPGAAPSEQPPGFPVAPMSLSAHAA
jgi:hypothetical protein